MSRRPREPVRTGTRRRTRSGRRPVVLAVAGSILLHGALVAGVWFTGVAGRLAPTEFEVYRVNIVSPAPAVAGESTPVSTDAEESTPASETEPRQEPDPAPTAEPEDEAEPESEQSEPPSEAENVSEKAEDAAPESPKGANPEPDSETGGEGINVQMDGEDFPYPGYLENIILQINRYFRWNGESGLVAEVYFVIRRDGSVEDIRIVRGSGDVSFNFEAMAAIEQAGKRRAFGTLPDDYPNDRLPISFYFRPSR